VEKRDVPLKANDVVEEVFHVSHKTSGLYRYEVRADALPGEVTTINNTAPLLLRVVDQPVRVLLLEGKPYWDTKFLVRTLSADPSVELTSVVQLAEGRLLHRRIPRQPVAAEKSVPATSGDTDREHWTIEKDAGTFLADGIALAAYQIVILGRNAEIFLTDDALSKLRKWLTEGEGSLVCFRGPPASQIGQRLGELMPMRCNGMGNCAGEGLRFQPILCEGLGNTIAQLLAQMGMGMGSGGLMGGYGMVGLYGGLPDMLGSGWEFGDGQGGDARRGAGQRGRPQGENPDQAKPGELFAPGTAAGASEGAVPVRYRRQVGQYFQRIAEETEESGH
jgi:hypothetical protein